MLSHINLFSGFLAYIDGGTGSFLIQALIAGAVSAGFIIKQRWAVIRGMIANRRASRS